jgi:hypothetical protein
VNLGDPAVMRRWASLAKTRLEERNQRLRSSGVRHLAIDLADDYAAILRRAFAPHRRAGRRR